MQTPKITPPTAQSRWHFSATLDEETFILVPVRPLRSRASGTRRHATGGDRGQQDLKAGRLSDRAGKVIRRARVTFG
jgi:hypothetical protein